MKNNNSILEYLYYIEIKCMVTIAQRTGKGEGKYAVLSS